MSDLYYVNQSKAPFTLRSMNPHRFSFVRLL